jgi:hypothetical protein
MLLSNSPLVGRDIDVLLFLLVKQAERERRACHLERLLSVIIHVSDQYSEAQAQVLTSR